MTARSPADRRARMVGRILGVSLFVLGAMEFARLWVPASQRPPSQFFDSLFMMGPALMTAGAVLVWLTLRRAQAAESAKPYYKTPRTLIVWGLCLVLVGAIPTVLFGEEFGLILFMIGPPGGVLIVAGAGLYRWRRSRVQQSG